MKNLNSLNNLMGKAAEAWMEAVWEELLDKLTKTKTKKDFKQLLEKLISEDERKMILRRLAVITLLRQGKSYREVGNILWVSPSNISTIKKNIFGPGHYKSYRAFYRGLAKPSSVKESKEKGTSQSFWDSVDDLLSICEKIFEPFLYPSTGIKHAAGMQKFYRKTEGK